jgi:CheY-like chemotaxis protein
MVKDLDIDLIFASDGREAVDRFREFKPDLIFMDISMPGMDGCDATREIRRIEAATGQTRVAIVAMTAHAMAADQEKIMAAGLDHYLTKTLRKAAIWEKILQLQPKGVRPVAAS